MAKVIIRSRGRCAREEGRERGMGNVLCQTWGHWFALIQVKTEKGDGAELPTLAFAVTAV